MNEAIHIRQEQAVPEDEDRRSPMDRRVIINFSSDQLKRVGVQVAEHYMREDRQGAWQLMQTYNLSGQGHYQLMAYAVQRLATYSGNASTQFIDWLTTIHQK